ncbi:acetyltransferase [Pontibacillus litoralis JSM 072002]|uniref:Acetyltransferase n=1 Tax=Pontibacillus litoralis JSM 072002 TaxID=1385512 RepID=A0A0A5HV82_9BACI|nr:acetyltransferase [Pontibacillus litoralis JSM 072002]
MYSAVQASINEWKPWLPFAQQEQSEVDVEKNSREAHCKFLKREDLRLLGFHKGSNQFIVSAGLHRIDWHVRKFKIGYWVDSRYAGKGYVTEAFDAIEKFAFEQLHANRIEIRCDAKNIKSRAVAEQLDYLLEGILRNDDYSVDRKELRDTCVYSKLRLLLEFNV